MVGTVAANSHIHPGDANFTVVSDSTLKYNIIPFTADLTKFKLVKPKKFKFKEEMSYNEFNKKQLKDTIWCVSNGGTISPVGCIETNKKIKAYNDSIQATFVTNDKNTKVHTGFMAQDFNQITGGTKLEIDYSDVMMSMWLKIQELEARIEELEKKTKILEDWKMDKPK